MNTLDIQLLWSKNHEKDLFYLCFKRLMAAQMERKMDCLLIATWLSAPCYFQNLAQTKSEKANPKLHSGSNGKLGAKSNQVLFYYNLG